mmetsp:Transcript_74176/g.138555  ORF Transcript_74176/g.138555 Transcript_74176/m.138555 type:complete len:124 (+) Transcript_74176:64-435(+)
MLLEHRRLDNVIDAPKAIAAAAIRTEPTTSRTFKARCGNTCGLLLSLPSNGKCHFVVCNAGVDDDLVGPSASPVGNGLRPTLLPSVKQAVVDRAEMTPSTGSVVANKAPVGAVLGALDAATCW